MKLNETLPIADCRLPIERKEIAAPAVRPLRAPRSALRTSRAFTLIELLTVIAIMAVIASMIFPIVRSIRRQAWQRTAKGEMDQIISALADYQAKYGTFPPSNPNLSPAINTLYYELSGVTHTNGVYTTLDSAAQITDGNYQSAFSAGGSSIDGIINCTKGGTEDGSAARNFLPSLKLNRIGTSQMNGGIWITNLVTSVRGPDATYKPLNVQDVNPFWYVYPGTNNPGSYDLWIDLQIFGKTNRVCNWRNAPFTL